MSFDKDFENMITRCLKDPEHHRRRRERFLAIRATEAFTINARRAPFGQRRAPPVAQY